MKQIIIRMIVFVYLVDDFVRHLAFFVGLTLNAKESTLYFRYSRYLLTLPHNTPTYLGTLR